MADEMRKILIDRFEKQDLKKGFFDVTFKIKDKVLHAHRFLLSAVSEPFESMFSENWTSSSSASFDPIEIKTCTFEPFKEFIGYFYHGSCNFDEAHIFDIVDLAEMYQVQSLKNHLNVFLSEMSFTDENILQLLEVSEVYGFQKLKNSLSNYLVANWKTLFERDDFLKVKEEVLLGILGLDRSGNEVLENTLFEKIFTWVENRVKEIIPNFDSLEEEEQQAKIKAEMAPFIPKFEFASRSMDFLNDFYIAERCYVFDDFEGVLEKAQNTSDYLDDDPEFLYRRFQILPYNFGGQYHQVLRGTVFARSEEPLIELIERIQQTYPNENGAFKIKYQCFYHHHHLKHAEDLDYDNDNGKYALAFDNSSGFVLLNREICECNQPYFDCFKTICNLEGNNFPGFKKEESSFCIQIL